MSKFPRRGPKTFSCCCAAQTFLGLNCDPVIFGAGSAPGKHTAVIILSKVLSVDEDNYIYILKGCKCMTEIIFSKVLSADGNNYEVVSIRP